MRKVKSRLIMALCLCSAGGGHAQELSLFQDIAVPASRPQQRARGAAAADNNIEPAFTLRGASRFADTYRVSLVSRDGSVVKVNWQAGESNAINGFGNFRLIEVGPRSASIQLPDNENCSPSEERGVSCSEGNTVALLSLPRATAIELTDSQQTNSRGSGNDNDAAATPGEPALAVLDELSPELSPAQQQAILRRRARLSRRLENRAIHLLLIGSS